jgi:hypothetical protein
MSDKQDAFVTGIAAEFPDVPHRYCQNHFLRDLAKPMLEQDSHAKVQMRKKVRGLRDIEKQILEDRRTAQAEAEPFRPASASTPAVTREPVAGAATASAPGLVGPQSSSVVGLNEPATSTATASAAEANTAGASVVSTASPPDSKEATAAAGTPVEPCDDEAGQVVLDYCSAVRGMLNDDQGGPLHPPGLRMTEALREVRASLQRNLEAKKGGARRNRCASSRTVSTGGCRKWPPSKSRSRSTSKR